LSEQTPNQPTNTSSALTVSHLLCLKRCKIYKGQPIPKLLLIEAVSMREFLKPLLASTLVLVAFDQSGDQTKKVTYWGLTVRLILLDLGRINMFVF